MSDKEVLEFLNSKGYKCNDVLEVVEYEAEEIIDANNFGLKDDDTVYSHVADTDDPDIIYALVVDDKDNKVVIHRIDYNEDGNPDFMQIYIK